MLIIFSGLPGTGKTTLARELAKELGAVYLRIDSAEQAMTRSMLKIESAEDAGYEVCYAIAEDNLRIGNAVVADSVNSIEITRQAWLDVAGRADVTALEIEIICSDKTEHQKRVESRKADIKGHVVPTWQEVMDRECDPWTRDRVVIDTENTPVAECLEEICKALK